MKLRTSKFQKTNFTIEGVLQNHMPKLQVWGLQSERYDYFNWFIEDLNLQNNMVKEKTPFQRKTPSPILTDIEICDKKQF